MNGEGRARTTAGGYAEDAKGLRDSGAVQAGRHGFLQEGRQAQEGLGVFEEIGGAS